jgi:hypothetical protein
MWLRSGGWQGDLGEPKGDDAGKARRGSWGPFCLRALGPRVWLGRKVVGMVVKAASMVVGGVGGGADAADAGAGGWVAEGEARRGEARRGEGEGEGRRMGMHAACLLA